MNRESQRSEDGIAQMNASKARTSGALTAATDIATPAMMRSCVSLAASTAVQPPLADTLQAASMFSNRA